MSSHGNISVLLEAKNEYNKHLVTVFKEHIIRIIKNIYIEAEEICIQENTPENIFMVFQDNLRKIKNWSGSKLSNEYNEIKRRSGCDWLDDLIKVIFVTNIKIMTMANKIKKEKEINIKIPPGTQILYLCILDTARKIWCQPYLFNKRNNVEYQRNMNEVNTIVENCIHEVLRSQLPVRNILQDYLDLEVDKPDAQFEVTQKVIKKLVTKELAELEEPKNKYKSKIAELLSKPATQKILPHNPDTDLIDDPSIEKPEPPVDNKPLKSFFKKVKAEEVVKPEPPIVTSVPEPVKETPVVVSVPEPVKELPVTTPEPVKETPVVVSVPEPVKEEQPVVVVPEPVKETPVTVPEPVKEESVKQVVSVPEPVKEQPVTVPEPMKELPVTVPEPVKEPPVTVPEPVKEESVKQVVVNAPEPPVKPVIKQTTSQTLDSLLSGTELADLDLELEEYSIDTLVNQKKALSPIKVKKTTPNTNFVFFKGAPKFPG